MRRMRDLTVWHYGAFSIWILGAGFGTYHLVKRYTPPVVKESAVVMKPSEFKTKERGKASRTVAGNRGEANMDHPVHPAIEREPETTQAKTEPAQAKTDATNAASPPQVAKETAAPENRTPSALEVAANEAIQMGKDCAPAEYRGNAPAKVQVSKVEWSAVMDQFHRAKDFLLFWLEQHRKEMPAATAVLMEQQVRNVKIQRPPSADEPDLSWRGTGIYTQGNDGGDPLIKLGGGFVKLAIQNPARAKFEMTRLVAQTWAPCELGRAGGEALISTWNPLLKCLGVTEAQSCQQGTYSEGGWAISTALAAAVSPPGCKMKIFESADISKCVKHIPFAASEPAAGAPGRDLASNEKGSRQ